jgi:hypothetical protein
MERTLWKSRLVPSLKPHSQLPELRGNGNPPIKLVGEWRLLATFSGKGGLG